MALIGIDIDKFRPIINAIPGNDMEEKAKYIGLTKHKLVQAYKGRASMSTVGAIKKALKGDLPTAVKQEVNKKSDCRKNKNRKKELRYFSLDSLLEEIISRGYEITLKS